jgi:hypothetical protein
MDLAAIRLEVRVNKFAVRFQLASDLRSEIADIGPTHSCTLASQACDRRVDPFPPMGNGRVHPRRQWASDTVDAHEGYCQNQCFHGCGFGHLDAGHHSILRLRILATGSWQNDLQKHGHSVGRQTSCGS